MDVPPTTPPTGESVLSFSGTMGDLDYRPVRVVPVTCSIADASRYFAASDVEFLVVHEHRIPVGVVHKFELLRLNMTRELPQEDPVASIMDRQVVTVQAHEPVLESLMFMVRHNVKVLLVMRHKEVMGAVSQTDWVRLQARYPTALLHELARAPDLEALADRRAQAEATIWGDFQTDDDVMTVVAVATGINDETTRRVITLALEQLQSEGAGGPPASFTWLAMGSAGRSSQTVLTDQDNGLIFEDVPAARLADVTAWFSRLAERIVAGLEACGFPRCEGNAMATNPDLLGSLTHWADLFERIIGTSDDKDLFEASIYFDFRAQFGPRSLADDLRTKLLESIERHPYFLRHLCEVAVQGSAPPLRSFRWRLYEATGVAPPPFDIKKRAIMPLDACVRVLALRHGIRAVSTLDRLAECMERGAIPKSLADSLRKAFDLLLRLRFTREFNAREAPKEERHLISVGRLLPAQARYLGDALVAVAKLREFTYQGVMGRSIPWVYR